MAKYIKVLLLTKHGASFVDLEDTCEAFNEALEWDDAWNTPTIRIDDVPYIVVCSDLGKVRHEPISCLSLANLYDNDSETIKEPFIVDNVIVTKFDGTDDFESLNDLDIERLRNRLLNVTGHKDMFNIILIID